MRTALPLIALLVLTTTARADMAPLPGFKAVEQQFRFEFAEQHPGYTFFVVSRCAEQLSTTGDTTAPKLGSRVAYWSRHFPLRLCAVPNEMLAEVRADWPDLDWFEKRLDDPRLRWSPEFGPRRSDSAAVTDPRERVIQTRRVTLTPTGIETEVVSEEVEKDWRTPLTIGGGCSAAVLALGVGSLWLVRRTLRRKPVARTTPPPGN